MTSHAITPVSHSIFHRFAEKGERGRVRWCWWLGGGMRSFCEGQHSYHISSPCRPLMWIPTAGPARNTRTRWVYGINGLPCDTAARATDIVSVTVIMLHALWESCQSLQCEGTWRDCQEDGSNPFHRFKC